MHGPLKFNHRLVYLVLCGPDFCSQVMRVGGLWVVALQFNGTVEMVTGCGQLASLCENQ